MFNPIDEVKRQYTYAVQPVQFFETKNSQMAQKNSFDFVKQTNNSVYNLFHPNITNSSSGNKLDLMS